MATVLHACPRPPRLRLGNCSQEYLGVPSPLRAGVCLCPTGFQHPLSCPGDLFSPHTIRPCPFPQPAARLALPTIQLPREQLCCRSCPSPWGWTACRVWENGVWAFPFWSPVPVPRVFHTQNGGGSGIAVTQGAGDRHKADL